MKIRRIILDEHRNIPAQSKKRKPTPTSEFFGKPKPILMCEILKEKRK